MKTRAGSFLQRAAGACVLLMALSGAGAAQTRAVAVGDIHGALDEFVALLQRIGLIDANRQWIGGSSILVQTGDVMDRGPETRACLDLLMSLERQAPKQNGKVLPLLGNHEVMNIMGDLRYVKAEDYRTFSSEDSEKTREKAYQDYREFLSATSRRRHTAAPDDEVTRPRWMAEHPLGFIEQRDSLGPQGLYGRWLRQHDAVARVGDVLFMHGGLNPKLHLRNIEELNNHVRSEIANFDSLWKSLSEKRIIWRYMTLEEALHQLQDEGMAIQARGQVEDPEAARKMQDFLGLQSWLIVSPDGPLWYRGYALEPEEKLKHALEAMMARLKVSHIVAAHTVRTKFSITPHFDNRVFLIDTGMLKAYYGGRASALEIQNGRFTAYYADGEHQVLVTPEGGAPIPARSQGESFGKQDR